jgi:serine palmitoyltransferase
MAGTGTLSPPMRTALSTYAIWTTLFLLGHVRDFLRQLFFKRSTKKGYAPIRKDYEDFYTRRLYYRVHDCWNRPICSAPTNWVDVLDRTKPDGQKALKLTGTTTRCLNLGSYNYLGFAADDPYCTPRVNEAMKRYRWSSSSPRAEAGDLMVHRELELEMADFLGKEACITCGMGFATNSTFIPILAEKGTLFISDALNHASIVSGVRGSGAKVKVFAHNNPDQLEALLRAVIAEGQPRTGRPWKKIIIIIEGIYSMEGEFAKLKEIVEIKKKYKAYLYLDEAHSIGAIGKTGRGVCEALGVDTKDVDIMMGTFTKSFGSCGGYIAGDKIVIDYLKANCAAHLYSTSMSAPAVEMVLSALRVVRGSDGSTAGQMKLKTLNENSNYFRKGLLKMGLNVLGDWDSPVMPIMMFKPSTLVACSREMLKRGVAVVVVGFPATPLLTARVRVCISACHSKEDLDFALDMFRDVSEHLGLGYGPASNQRHLEAARARGIIA